VQSWTSATGRVAETSGLGARLAGTLQDPQITRTGRVTAFMPATTVSGTAGTAGTGANPPVPTGTWVERIPNARGKALAAAIAAVADRYRLDPAFLAAVFFTESSYVPDAVSRTGAIGLGQLMPETAAWLGVDPWDPMQNMEGSARLYRWLIDKYDGDMTLAISAYAAGPGAVARAGGVPDQFTANYVTKLLGRTDYLNGLRSSMP
jgi:soluble lytic murein transglycosylase-like protein